MVTTWALALIAAGMLGILVFRSHAPAVSLALMGALAGGAIGFVEAHGRSVPEHVAERAVLGLLLLGIVGLFLTRGRPPARWLVGAAVVVFIGGGGIATISWFVMRGRCPQYDPAIERFCAGVDLFFGISGVVLAYVIIGVVLLTAFVLASAWQARRVATVLVAGSS
jgi:peptidoglycan/LPS O-acetylase OafA/YrhL